MRHHLIALLLMCILSIHNTNTHSFQVQHTTNNPENLLKSLQNELKDPSYRTEILPNNFSHLFNLITSGNTNNQSPTYLRSIIKLFSNMLKGAEYVNAYEFESFMARFPILVQPYFSLNASKSYITQVALYDAHMFDRFKVTVNNVLYMKFSSEYESFKRNPNEFLEYISSEIVTIAQEEITREQLRQGIIRFAEIALSKLIWDVSNPEKSWDNTKKIATHFATLLEYNILDDLNDLDDLYWSLLTRYCYFIDVTAIDLFPAFYTTIKNDISSGKVLLLELAEQDSFVEPKLSYMQRTIMKAQAQSEAYHTK
jgi:hypothetical protein